MKVKVNTSTKFLTVEVEYPMTTKGILALEESGLIVGDRLSMLKFHETSAISDVRFDKEQKTVRIFCVRDRSKNFTNEIEELMAMHRICMKMQSILDVITEKILNMTFEILTIKQ